VYPGQQIFLKVTAAQAVEFCSVAGAKNDHFLDAFELHQFPDVLAVIEAVDGHPLPDFNRGGVVADS
jgi:hypothetical protein